MANRFQPNGEWGREKRKSPTGVRLFTRQSTSRTYRPQFHVWIIETPWQDWPTAYIALINPTLSRRARADLRPATLMAMPRCAATAQPLPLFWRMAVSTASTSILITNAPLVPVDARGREFSAQSCFDRCQKPLSDCVANVNFLRKPSSTLRRSRTGPIQSLQPDCS